MSEQYNEYIKEHKNNVHRAFEWMEKNIPEIFVSPYEDLLAECRYQCDFNHDNSKYDEDEYEAYDLYFYGGNRSYEVVQNFNEAWLTHIHKNKHHWQHWVLINDDPDKGEIILDMPDVYIIEMICDWWSFSWKSGKLDEMLTWYENHKDYMKLSKYTRMKVEYILTKIYIKLALSGANAEGRINNENND